MQQFNNPLDNVTIASPCSADWNSMYGSERKRFCGDCKLNVYNLSGMTQTEAEALITNSEGRLCVRFYRRADGSVLTRDCPVGWAMVKRRMRAFAGAMGALFIALFSGVLFASLFSKSNPAKKHLTLISVIKHYDEPLMGAIAAPPTKRPEPESRKEVVGKIAVD